MTFLSVELNWCFIFKVPEFISRLKCIGDALKTVSLHWKEFWQQSHFMAVSMLMILVLIYGLIYYGLDKLIFEKMKKMVLKIQITYPNFLPDNLRLTFHSLHAIFINGHWKEYQKLEPEMRILYRTIQICNKFSLV